MSTLVPFARRLWRNREGSTIVEFAIIGPAMITLLLGVVQTGFQVQNYNAVRNLASDGARFTAVQYQKGTRSAPDTIETWMRARGVGGVYNLDTDRLTVDVTQQTTSQLAGLVEMNISVSYAAPDYLWSVAGDALTISVLRPVFLPPAT